MDITLDDIDFGKSWKAMNALRRRPDDASYWDGRAKEFSQKAGKSPYAPRFLELMRLEPGESVFDMGCGSGTLSVPLAKAGHEVHAADFSEQMIRYLNKASEEYGLSGRIFTHRLSWAQDWDAAKIPVCDVAIASRSIMTEDLEDSLAKLSSRARKRVCITLPLRNSPRYDPVLWEAVGRTRTRTPEPLYALGMLLDMGFAPEMQLIVTRKDAQFASREEAVANALNSLHETTPEEDELFRSYCEKHIKPKQTDGGQTVWVRDYEQNTYWAFISWNK